MVSDSVRCKRKTPEVNPTHMRTKSNKIVMRSSFPVSEITKPDLCQGKKLKVLNWI